MYKIWIADQATLPQDNAPTLQTHFIADDNEPVKK